MLPPDVTMVLKGVRAKPCHGQRIRLLRVQGSGAAHTLRGETFCKSAASMGLACFCRTCCARRRWRGTLVRSVVRNPSSFSICMVGTRMRRNNGTVLHGQAAGFLGTKHSPLMIDQDLQGNHVRVDAVSPRAEVPLLRLSSRRRLLEQVDAQRRDWEQSLDVQTLDAYQQRALSLLSAPALAKAFDLAHEAASIRE